ncbi:uncharacterized protein LOC110379775 [Helicoverpa armigera]|uniref:uncharacterized protein LOC110379775 n=1 Tax=Helicoverpa armigera TaxID=29058 RepID=UPI0030829202
MYVLRVLVFSSYVLLVKSIGFEEVAGKGRWLMLNILQCEDADDMEFNFDLTRRKINRTHDAFSFKVDFDREINETYGIEIVAYKEVDGGFKLYHQMQDESFCTFVKKYTGDNWEKFFKMANIDPPDCPIKPGEVKVVDFILDYKELEETGLYGVFDASNYMLDKGRRVGCVRLLTTFEKDDDDDDDDDDS